MEASEAEEAEAVEVVVALEVSSDNIQDLSTRIDTLNCFLGGGGRGGFGRGGGGGGGAKRW